MALNPGIHRLQQREYQQHLIPCRHAFSNHAFACICSRLELLATRTAWAHADLAAPPANPGAAPPALSAPTWSLTASGGSATLAPASTCRPRWQRWPWLTPSTSLRKPPPCWRNRQRVCMCVRGPYPLTWAASYLSCRALPGSRAQDAPCRVAHRARQTDDATRSPLQGLARRGGARRHPSCWQLVFLSGMEGTQSSSSRRPPACSNVGRPAAVFLDRVPGKWTALDCFAVNSWG
jgi:hypothetical protein